MDYLLKTYSNIIVPKIILDEIKGLYRNTLIERIQKHNKTTDNINLSLISKKDHLPLSRIDVEYQCKKYISFVKRRLKITSSQILPYNNKYLPQIAKRAINRLKPAGDDGQGFRDVLIWLTIRDYCCSTVEKQIIFIGNNHKDFASDDKNCLHDQLKKECDKLGIQIHYYRNIKDFIEAHSIKINFITNEWLTKNVDENAVIQEIKEQINERTIIDGVKKSTGLDCTGGYKVGNIEISSYNNFFVYETADSRLVVIADMTFFAGIEFDFYDGPHLVQVDFDRWEDQFSKGTGHDELKGVGAVTLIIENKKIEFYEVSQVSFEPN
jgi:hypothetical protein